MRVVAKTCFGLLAFAVLAATTNALGADLPDNKMSSAKTCRASKLTGMTVKNEAGEKLGTIDDFVINTDTGKIAYVALSVGGVLGIGDKLFAVPFGEMRFHPTDNEHFFVLNVSKERLEKAPGFDKSQWPNMADPRWAEQIDNYYRKAQAPATTTR